MLRSTSSVFLSHAGGKDDRWTRWIHHELVELGFDVTVDYGIWATGQAAERIDEALSQCFLFVPVLSPRYFEAGRWTQDEIAGAWSQQKRDALRIVAFCVEKVEQPGLYESLLSRHLYELTEVAARRALKDYIARAVTLPTPKQRDPTEKRPAYPGPHAKSPMLAHNLSPEVELLIAKADALAEDVIASRDVSELDMVHLMANTQTLAQLYNHEAPGRILELASPKYERTKIALDSTRDPRQLAEIYYILGRLHAILSYATLDLGRDDTAKNHSLAVIRCGRHAAHSELEAWGWGTLSMILRFQGKNEQSVAKALSGLELTVSGSSAARLHAQAALSYVELHNVDSSTEQLKACDEIVDLPPASPEMRDGIFFFSRAKHHYYAGSAYADFGPAFAPRAVEESRSAIEWFRAGDADTRSYSDELLANVHLARGLFMSEKFDEIPDALAALFQSDPDYRTSWHVQWLDRLIVALKSGKARGSRTLGEIEESVEEFIDETTSGSGR